MNEELEQLIQEVKSILPWLLAAGIVVAGYHGVRKYVANRRAAASEVVASAYTTEELEDAAAKFKGSKVDGVIRLRLAKSYYDSANYESALEIYESLEGKAPDGFEDVPVVGKAQCLEALKASVGDDELSKSRVDTTLQIVKRYEKRAERSLFEAADAAQKQLETEAVKADAAKKTEAEAPKDEAPAKTE